MNKIIIKLVALFFTLSLVPAITNYALAQRSEPKRWGIIFSADKTKEEAEDELEKAKTFGFPASLYLCNSWYRGVIVFAERKSGLANLTTIKQKLRNDSYLVDMSDWCIQNRKLVIQSSPVKYKTATVFAPPSNIRSTPNGSIVCSIRSRTTINILGKTGQWFYTDFCGKRGVIHQSQIKM